MCYFINICTWRCLVFKSPFQLQTLLRVFLLVCAPASVCCAAASQPSENSLLQKIDYQNPFLFTLPEPHPQRHPDKAALDWVVRQEAFLEKQLAKYPDAVYFRVDKAHLQQIKGNLQDAISQCEIANKIKMTGFGLYRHASISFDLGKWQQTVDDATAALIILPDNKETLALRLAAYKRLNENKKAMQDEIRILEILKKDLKTRKDALIESLPRAQEGLISIRYGYASFSEQDVHCFSFTSNQDWRSEEEIRYMQAFKNVK